MPNRHTNLTSISHSNLTALQQSWSVFNSQCAKTWIPMDRIKVEQKEGIWISLLHNEEASIYKSRILNTWLEVPWEIKCLYINEDRSLRTLRATMKYRDAWWRYATRIWFYFGDQKSHRTILRAWNIEILFYFSFFGFVKIYTELTSKEITCT